MLAPRAWSGAAREDRQPHGERRSVAFAGARHAHAAAVRLDEVLDDRQAEAEAAVTPRVDASA